MNAVNYQKQLEEIIKKHGEAGEKPTLLLHCCCAPCASYCLEFLNGKFDITCFFYNPNITDEDEYNHRLDELKKLISCAFYGAFKVIDAGFNPQPFYENAKGREHLPEGGERCFNCYALRLDKTSEVSEEGGFDYFTTTLSISPYKNSRWLNEIGAELSETYGVRYLYSDFKKKNGYKRSCELSEIHSLYRQDYCGCEFSRIQRDNKNNH